MEWSRLSRLEQVVARELASSLAPAEIGRRLYIGGSIIENLTRRLQEKTETTDRPSLVVWIAAHDFGRPLNAPAALPITQPVPTYVRRAGDAPLRHYVAQTSEAFPIMPAIDDLVDSK